RGGAAKRTVYQGSVSDIALPPARAYRVVIDDKAGLARAIGDETKRLGAPVQTASAAAVATRNHFGARDFMELGVGCESCHNGARAHAQSKGAVPSSLVPTSPLLHVELDGNRDIAPAQQINHVCLRCHTVLFSQYSFTWEGGLRAQSPGGSTINSGEARDFQLGGCADRMSCVRCHDPHGRDAREKLDSMGTVAGNGLCLSCHANIAGDVSAHTHHASDSAGSACLACHMPKKNAGLDGNLTRYHRIGSPTDDARVLGDRPLECALCHADKSVASIVNDMERLWGKRYDRAKLTALYGDDLDVNALIATVQRGHPHEQLVAADVLGERGVVAGVPALVDALPSRIPLVRPYIKRALERLRHAPFDVNLDDDADALAASARAIYRASP
ncbi:MAG TPA: cytochrome c3 family protein, partial [Myxococcota bacterium]